MEKVRDEESNIAFMDQTPVSRKFVAVLNEKIRTGVLMNALGHMAAGLAGGTSNLSDMRFDNYLDKSNIVHRSISDCPFIILKAENSNQIRKLRGELVEAGIEFVDFTGTMTIGTYTEQKERTAITPEPELEYYGICTFGEIEKINQFTKRYSLWR